MSDLPDYQSAIDIARQDIAYLVIDLAKQTLATLAVDIKAQTLTKLAVDIVTQTLSELNVNITAQDLAQLVIKIAAQSVGVYLQPEWAANQGADVNKFGSTSVYPLTWTILIDYTTPATKKLYISHWGIAVSHEVSNVVGYLVNWTTGQWLAVAGGAQGAFAPLNKPIVIDKNEEVRFYAMHFATQARTMLGHIGGYEI